MNLVKFNYFFLTLIFVLFTSCTHEPSIVIKSFSINGVTATIEDISITISLPAGTVLTSLSPSINVPEGVVITPASGVAQDFTKPVIYKATTVGGATKSYVAMVVVNADQSDTTPLCDSAIVPTANGFQSGDGTRENPYIICSATQLNLIGVIGGLDPSYPLLTKSYKLGSDIDMNGVNFNIIGKYLGVDNFLYFSGVFDGNNKKISNLNINAPTDYNVGFIGSIGLGGEIKNLGLNNVTITGKAYVGGLVANNYYGSINNCHVSGVVTGTVQDNIGGLVGSNYGTIANSYTTGTVTATSPSADDNSGLGGLIGTNYESSVNNSYSTANVSGSDDYVGGLIGYAYNYGGHKKIISNSCSTGNVSGKYYTGGLIGSSENEVYNCYATGNVTSSSGSVGGLIGDTACNSPASCKIIYSYATGSVLANGTHGDSTGGLVGNNWQHSIINSYSTASVTCSAVSGCDGIGGLVGSNDTGPISFSYSIGLVTKGDVPETVSGGLIGVNVDDPIDVSNSYWDTDTSGQLLSAGGTGKTDAEMKLQATFTGWDFNLIWSIDPTKCSSCPLLPSPYTYPCLRPMPAPII